MGYGTRQTSTDQEIEVFALNECGQKRLSLIFRGLIIALHTYRAETHLVYVKHRVNRRGRGGCRHGVTIEPKQ